MDYVDDFQPTYLELDQLDLGELDTAILRDIGKRFDHTKVRYVRIDRGLSPAIKIVAKPERLFPLLIKIDDVAAITREEEGDRLIRHRVPPLSIPPLECVVFNQNRGAIAYRYVTGGRVRNLIRRFDVVLSDLSTYAALSIIDDIFDVILKKCHWLDGNYTLRPIQLPDLPPNPKLSNDPNWSNLLERYTVLQRLCAQVQAPHAIVHGDLHPKNVLITRNDAPVLIDFAMAQRDVCQYWDFAKFETTLQFQVDRQLAEQMWRFEELLYGETELIVPHSNSKLAACIQRARGNLWQGCTRQSLQMKNDDIDLGYRGYLVYCLTRFYSRLENSSLSRSHAHRQALALSTVYSR